MAKIATPTTLPADIRLMNVTAGLLAAIGVGAIVVVLLMWLMRQPLFAVQSIRIEGDLAHNSALTIRANAAPRLTGNFFTLDLAAGRRAFEAVPWVRQALVQRVWPNRLRVLLEEHRAAALWEGGGDAADKLVNSFGEVFEANLGDVEDEALPTLRGPEAAAAQMLTMLRRLGPVLAPMEARIDALDLSGRGSWRVELDSGAEIELGRGSDDEVIARAERFVSTVTQVTSRYQRPVQYADLRHNEGYAVRLKGISTTVDPSGKPARK
jgi:cell division protein FtsQ